MEPLFVVPSYRRAKALAEKTLPLLARHGVDPSKLFVFVADDDEARAYAQVVPEGCNLVVAVPGMMAVRNFITDYFDEGQPLVCFDDDIVELYRRVDAKHYEPLESLQEVVEQGFAACAQHRARLWGVYPVLNAMFMKPNITHDLRYIVGCVWGALNTKAVKVTTDDKEDFERTILFYRHSGAVVRVNYVAPKTAYYSEPGGMQVERTEERVRASAVYLAEKYSDFCSLNTSKKSGHWEVRLKDKQAALVRQLRRGRRC